MLSEKQKSILKKTLTALLQISIVGYLVYQLYKIGITEIIQSVPDSLLFYLLFLPAYFSLPISEVFIYKITWKFNWRVGIPIFLQKKVLNSEFIKYSGHLLLLHWAKTTLKIPSKEAILTIKDNVILSAAASWLITISLLFYFLSKGTISINEIIESIGMEPWVIILGLCLIFSFIIFNLRNNVISEKNSEVLLIFLIHSGRLIFIYALQIFQWYVADPSIALEVWFSLAVVQIINSRIPFVPSKDVLFASLAMGSASLLGTSEEIIGGIVIANLIMKKVFNALSYLVAISLKNKHPNLSTIEKDAILKL